MSNPRILAILNLLGWAAVLTVNTLANSLPINGYNTGQISAFYPNLFVPAGFTFAIWSVIYLLMTGFAVTATRWLWHRPTEPAGRVALAVSPLFLLGCGLNAGWILAWHFLQTGLSVILMLAFLATLVRTYLVLQTHRNDLQGPRRIFLYQFFIVYLGWISVATIANITAWLVSLSWNGFGIPPAAYSIALILIATALGAFFTLGRRDAAYGLVIAWALFGIQASQATNHPPIGWTARAGYTLLLAIAAYGILRKPAPKPGT
jgi:hypothetical protein